MSESCLSQRISLCRYIEGLNDDGCLQVIRLLQQSQKYTNLNQFLKKVVIKTTEKMNHESLEHVNNEVKQISSNNKYIRIDTPLDNKQRKKKQCTSTSISNKGENIIFPLFRLPIDIIKNTSSFINIFVNVGH